MKTILLWDSRFPDRRPARLTIEDTVASAAVRAGVAAAANPAEAGALSAGAALDPTMLTEVVIQHGSGNATRRVYLPYSVVMVGAAAGVLASIGTPIPGGVTPTPTPTPTPSPAPTPSGDRTVLMTQRRTLPDGLYADAVGVGYPCTGADIDRTNGTFWCAHGSDVASLNTGPLNLSADFTTIISQITVGSMGLLAGSVQGIAIDTSDNTLWFVLKATSEGARLVHCTEAGVLINSVLFSSPTTNGLAYDSKRDCLIRSLDDGSVGWINKPAVGATTLTAFGKTGFTAAGGNNDQLAYDLLRDEVLVSGGANDESGTVDVYDVSASTAPTRRSTITLDQAKAIEGIVRRGDDIIVWSDQYTHPGSRQATNQVQTYVNAMVVTVSAPVFAFAAAPVALEGDAQIFTLNVIRNGTTGALVGAYQVGPAASASADANDFGGTFATGSFTIADGATSTTITITSSEDAVQEGSENYTLTASYGGSVVATVTAAIGEDDAPAGSYRAESTALFARMTTQPSSARKTAIDTLMGAIVDAGIFGKSDAFYVFAAHEQPSAQLNWIADARNAVMASESNSLPVFTVDRGLATNGANSYIDYGFSPATATKFLQDDAGMAIWCNDSAAATAGTASLGVAGSNNVGLNPRATSDVMAGRINSTTAITGGPITDAKGLSAQSRSAGPVMQLYKNGQPVGSAGTPASAAKVTGNFRTGFVNQGDRVARNVAAVRLGGGLNASEQLTFYNALAAYMTAVGNI